MTRPAHEASGGATTGPTSCAGPDGYRLHEQYLNPQTARLLRTIGFDTVYTRAEGAYLYDAGGNRYLDFLAGFGVHGVGRNHPAVRAALHKVLDTDVADLVQFDCPAPAGMLAERLVARSPGLDRVFLCNSGTEAVETALKFARHATGKRRVIYCDHAYHGLTAGSLSVNGSDEFREGFGPLLPDTKVPLGNLDRLRHELQVGDVAALVVEPIQGKGVYPCPPGYLAEARELLHAHGALLICDEVQTGVGRTGRFYAYEHDDVLPDIVTVAKALSGGFVPIGAALATDEIFGSVYSSIDRVLVHDTTFGGNALAATAGRATLDVLDDEDLVANAERRGKRLVDGLRTMAERFDLIADVRGRGLIIGIEFGKPGGVAARSRWAVLQAARTGLFAQMVVVPLYRQHGILTQVAGDHLEVIKLLPPLTISDADVDYFLDAFADVMSQAQRGSGLMWHFGRTLVAAAVKNRRAKASQ